jgi:hypothetical protein
MASARSCRIVATSLDRSERRQAIAVQRLDEVGGKRRVSLEPFVKRSVGLELAEEFVQGPRAKGMDSPRQLAKALAGNQRGLQ